MKETRKIYNYPLYHTENATLKQTLNEACPVAQSMASSVLDLTETLQSKHFFFVEAGL